MLRGIFPAVPDIGMKYSVSIPIKHVSAALALAQRGRKEIERNQMVFTQNEPAEWFATALRVGFPSVIGNKADINSHIQSRDQDFKIRGEYGRKKIEEWDDGSVY